MRVHNKALLAGAVLPSLALAAKKPTISAKAVVSSGSNAYNYVSCWTSGKGIAPLTGASTSSLDMTNEKCADFCAGTPFFALAGGNVCYCGEFVGGGSAAVKESTCSTVCPGDNTELCGSLTAVSLYALTGHSPSDLVASPKKTAGAFEYVSCWSDFVGRHRALGAASYTSSSMTAESCAAFCNGFTYFGLGNGRECYCGNATSSGSAAAEVDCSFNCEGDSSQLCGAVGRINMYKSNGIVVLPSTTTVSTETATSTDSASVTDAATSTGAASTSTDAASTSTDAASTSTDATSTSTDAASTSTDAASTSTDAASTSTDAASTSTDAASTSTDAASTSTDAASTSTDAASTSTDAASTSTDAASTSTDAASTSTDAASTSTDAASSSTDAASSSTDAASTSTDAASTSTDAASTSTDAASTSTDAASTSTDAASTSTDAASTSTDAASISTDAASTSTDAATTTAASTSDAASTTDVATSTSTDPYAQMTEVPGYPDVAGYRFVSCWTEAQGVRALSGAGAVSDTLTLGDCAAFCDDWPYFGVEYGRECYCGAAPDALSQAAPLSDCSMTCSGDNTENCGGNNRLNVYHNPLKSGPRAPATVGAYSYFGCATDSPARTLYEDMTASDAMTLETCADFCMSRLFTFFGTEYGRECWCGDELANDSQLVDDGECNKSCAGNGKQLCGQSNRLTVYKLSAE